MDMEHLPVNVFPLWSLSSEFCDFLHINLPYIRSYVRFIAKYFILQFAYVNHNVLISDNTCSLLVYRKVIAFGNIN